ncbi:MAG: DM13 domain-containing protein [Wenzhouxiangellaceae bacterium]
MKRYLFLTGLLLAAGLGWFLFSPLFIDRTVNEPLSFVDADGHFDMAQVMALTTEEQQQQRSAIMAAARDAPDHDMAEAMPRRTAERLAHGQFHGADAIHQGNGDALIYALPDAQDSTMATAEGDGVQSLLLRLENFRVTNGPDLKVYLARHPDPQSADDVENQGFVSLGDLKGNLGNQNYPLPGDIDWQDYHSVVIWCELFGVLFAAAPLQSSMVY